LEPSASKEDLLDLSKRANAIFSIPLPTEYLKFLSIINGLDFNGLVFYGTKDSEIDPDSSPLDLVNMNILFKEGTDNPLFEIIILGENSTGILVFDLKLEEFQFRDRIGVERTVSYKSFIEMLKEEVMNVMT